MFQVTMELKSEDGSINQGQGSPVRPRELHDVVDKLLDDIVLSVAEFREITISWREPDHD